MRIIVLEDDPLQAELVHDQLQECFQKVECTTLSSESEFFRACLQ